MRPRPSHLPPRVCGLAKSVSLAIGRSPLVVMPGSEGTGVHPAILCPSAIVRSMCTVLMPLAWGRLPLLLSCLSLPRGVAVGMPVTRHPPHRSRRAALPHRAPASGDDVQTLRQKRRVACRTRSGACDRRPRHCVRILVRSTTFPSASLLPSPCSAGPCGRPLFAGFVGTMRLSDSLHPCITLSFR